MLSNMNNQDQERQYKIKNSYTKNSSTRIYVRLSVNDPTKKNTSGTKKVQTYQNLINVTNPYMSIKMFRRESRKKKQRTTRTNITRKNEIIAKRIITKKMIATRRKRREKSANSISDDLVYEKLFISKRWN